MSTASGILLAPPNAAPSSIVKRGYGLATVCISLANARIRTSSEEGEDRAEEPNDVPSYPLADPDDRGVEGIPA